MVDKTNSSKSGDLLLHEFQEAWSHYRHIEESRSQYLGFFFIVMLSSIGFLISLSQNLDLMTSSWSVFGILILFWLLYILTFFMFVSVRKMGVVKKHYEDVIARIREHFYIDEPDLNKILNIRDKKHQVMQSSLFSVQTSAEYILIGSCIILTLIEVIGFFILAMWQKYIIAVLAAIMILMLFHVILRYND